MAKGVYLANPELNNDDVELAASSEMGARAGAPVAFASNSGLLNMTAIGDAGDGLAHTVQVLGGQNRPRYSPLTTGGLIQYCAPETFLTLSDTVPCTSDGKIALAVADDRLYAIVATGGVLNVYVWTGSTWTLKASGGEFADAGGGISAATIESNIYIAVANNTDSVVEMYRFNRDSSTIGQVSESMAVTEGAVDGIALASNGVTFVLLVSEAGDVSSWFGGVGDMTEDTDTIGDRFNTPWGSSGVSCPGITHNETYGYVACFKTSTGALKVALTPNGDTWRQFKDLNLVIRQPTASSGWGSAENSAIEVENRRVFTYRVTSSDVKMQWFDGRITWSAEVDADGGVAINSGTQISAVNWRGDMYVAWRSSSSAISVRKNNGLTTTNTGYTREIRFGEPMFVAGLDDDSGTALFFTATGSITGGDKWTIPAAEYDYRVEHLLDDFLSKVWRGEDGGEQTVTLDAGSGSAFIVDTFALFRSNFPSLTLEMDDDSGFGSPSLSQVISAVVKTATIVSVDRNRVVFASGTFEKNAYTEGTSRYWLDTATGIYRILENDDHSLKIDGSASGASTTGVASIFRDSMAYLFSSPVVARYLRFRISSVNVPDNFLTASRILFGMRFEPDIDYRIQWAGGFGQQMARTELKDGGRFNTNLNFAQRSTWELTYRYTNADVRPLIGFFGRTLGGTKLFGFWPEPSALSGNQPIVLPMYFTTEPIKKEDLDGYASDITFIIEGQI